MNKDELSCYYEGDDCSGEIVRVFSFKKALCQKCLDEENSLPDNDVDEISDAMDYMRDWE